VLVIGYAFIIMRWEVLVMLAVVGGINLVGRVIAKRQADAKKLLEYGGPPDAKSQPMLKPMLETQRAAKAALPEIARRQDVRQPTVPKAFRGATEIPQRKAVATKITLSGNAARTASTPPARSAFAPSSASRDSARLSRESKVSMTSMTSMTSMASMASTPPRIALPKFAPIAIQHVAETTRTKHAASLKQKRSRWTTLRMRDGFVASVVLGQPACVRF